MPRLSLFAPASSPPSLVQSWSDRPPGRRSRPLAATSCLRFPPLLGCPEEFLAQVLPSFPPSGCPPFPSSTCAQVPVGPNFLPSRGPFLPMPASINLTPPPPLPALTGGPVPCRSWVVASFSSSPRPLCFCLALPVFRSVSWCILKFDSSGVLLRKNLRSGRLHSLDIARPIPRPHATWP